MSRQVIVGPPGTGKSSTLLKIIEAELAKGTPPKRIGFVSFTKKAANEGINRACDIFGLSRRDLPYFQTLHSMAFNQLGLTRSRVMSGRQLHDFAAWMGLDLTFSQRFDDEQQYQAATPDDKALFCINLARIRQANLRDEAKAAELNWHLVKTMDYGLRQFKRERGLVDFTDMLEQFCRLEGGPEFDLLCIDEAQDMSALQWEMAEKLMSRSAVTYIAGDDDQAIFGWAGADTDRFRTCASGGSDTRVLGQSYRVPVTVQRIAATVIGRISNRYNKEWNPRAFAGSVRTVQGFADAPIETGQWLILARNAFLLQPVYAWLSELGLSTDKRITVSTIHRSKGGEADNVLLLTDCARRTWETIESDDEHRVFYVAVTRARNNLYICEPTTRYYYEI